jgi:hypothetical protein
MLDTIPKPLLPTYHVWSRFYQALQEAAERFNCKGPRKVKIYLDCNGRSDSEGFQQLLRDVAAHTLAGVMFAFTPYDLVGTSILETARIPRVAGRRPGRFTAPPGSSDGPLAPPRRTRNCPPAPRFWSAGEAPVRRREGQGIIRESRSAGLAPRSPGRARPLVRGENA